MLLTFALRTPDIFCRGVMVIDENNFLTQRYSSKDARDVVAVICMVVGFTTTYAINAYHH